MRIGLDLDGTLLDCKSRQTQLMETLARACGLRVASETFWSLKRDGLNNRAALREMGLSDPMCSRLGQLWELAIEDRFWVDLDVVLPSTFFVLDRWRRARHSLHLVSARRDAVSASQQLWMLGLNHWFETVTFVDPRSRQAKLAVFNRELFDVYVGDTEVDAHCADAANVRIELVTTGLRSPEFLRRQGNWPIHVDLTSICL